MDVVKTLIHPYHGFNIFFSLSFICAKLVEPIHRYVFPSDSTAELSTWESEVLFFLIVVVMFRSRRCGARSAIAYISLATTYAKACNIILWFSADPVKGVVYLFALLIHFLLVGEPVYVGGENLTYFQGCPALDEALDSNDGTVWVIAFYTAWATSCVSLAPIFAKLSLEYSLPNLKFGKVDVGKYPAVAKKYHINDTSLSVQLPTIALYQDGKLLMRRPTVDSQKRLQKFFFTEDNIRAAYDLNNLHLDCQRKLKEKKNTRVKKD